MITEINLWPKAEDMSIEDCFFEDDHLYVITRKNNNMQNIVIMNKAKWVSKEEESDDEDLTLSPEGVSRTLKI